MSEQISKSMIKLCRKILLRKYVIVGNMFHKKSFDLSTNYTLMREIIVGLEQFSSFLKIKIRLNLIRNNGNITNFLLSVDHFIEKQRHKFQKISSHIQTLIIPITLDPELLSKSINSLIDEFKGISMKIDFNENLFEDKLDSIQTELMLEDAGVFSSPPIDVQIVKDPLNFFNAFVQHENYPINRSFRKKIMNLEEIKQNKISADIEYEKVIVEMRNSAKDSLKTGNRDDAAYIIENLNLYYELIVQLLKDITQCILEILILYWGIVKSNLIKNITKNFKISMENRKSMEELEDLDPKSEINEYRKTIEYFHSKKINLNDYLNELETVLMLEDAGTMPEPLDTKDTEEELKSKFLKIMGKSEKIKVETVYNMLGLERKDFEKRFLFEWGDMPYKINGDYITASNIQGFLSSLDKNFEDWENSTENGEAMKKP